MLVTLDLVEPTVLADMGLEIRDSDISGSRVNVPSKCKQIADYYSFVANHNELSGKKFILVGQCTD